jgi:hypothetical protein
MRVSSWLFGRGPWSSRGLLLLLLLLLLLVLLLRLLGRGRCDAWPGLLVRIYLVSLRGSRVLGALRL